MTGTRKIPHHVARELQRHVKNVKVNQAQGGKGRTANEDSDLRGKSLLTLLGCVGFVGVTASSPLWLMKWIGPLNERDGELTQAQIRRGAFNNSGSRDAGKDPNWDFRNGKLSQYIT